MQDDILDYEEKPSKHVLSKLALVEMVLLLVLVFVQIGMQLLSGELRFLGRLLVLLVFVVSQIIFPFLRFWRNVNPWIALGLAILGLLSWLGYLVGVQFRISSWAGGSAILLFSIVGILLQYALLPLNEKFYQEERQSRGLLYIFVMGWMACMSFVLFKFESWNLASYAGIFAILLNGLSCLYIGSAMMRNDTRAPYLFDFLPKSVFFLYWALSMYF
ncbi:MAG: hypothetical protein AAFV95_15875 [Bacteroidota bacterium]